MSENSKVLKIAGEPGQRSELKAPPHWWWVRHYFFLQYFSARTQSSSKLKQWDTGCESSKWALVLAQSGRGNPQYSERMKEISLLLFFFFSFSLSASLMPQPWSSPMAALPHIWHLTQGILPINIDEKDLVSTWPGTFIPSMDEWCQSWKRGVVRESRTSFESFNSQLSLESMSHYFPSSRSFLPSFPPSTKRKTSIHLRLHVSQELRKNEPHYFTLSFKSMTENTTK